MDGQFEEELAYFHRERRELERAFGGKVVAIRRNQLVGVYPDRDSAEAAVARDYPGQRLLVRELALPRTSGPRLTSA